MRESTLVRWTGRGRVRDLAVSVRAILKIEGVRAKVKVSGRTVTVKGPDPIRVAGLLKYLPGVAWLAVGGEARTVREVAREAAGLAVVYLKPKGHFVIMAESTVESVKPSDLVGAANSAVLEAVKGARVNEDAPSVVFRIAYDSHMGVAAVQLDDGPGGVPIGDDTSRCLVSGGRHSSVVAWYALLAGYAVELVHAKVDDRSLRAVALLYAELSSRVDPRRLGLEVIEGGGIRDLLTKWVKVAGDPVFAGFHAAGRLPPLGMGPAASPLYLLSEEEYELTFRSLGIKEDDRVEGWRHGSGGGRKTLGFRGTRADVHKVLDGLS